MDQFEILFQQLRRTIAECEKSFVSVFIPPSFSHRPQDYEPGVRAYCVLSFAALEYYFECVALLLATEAVSLWQRDHSQSDIALRLAFLFPDVKFAGDFPKKSLATQTTRERLVKSAEYFEAFVAESNHSINPTAFAKLFWPVGIHAVGNLRQFSSLTKLRVERGKHAHTMASNTLPPEAAINIVRDCMELGAEIQEAASQKLYGKSKSAEMRKLVALLQARADRTT